MKTYFYATSIILALAGSVQAGPFQYECTIESVMNDDGSNDLGFLGVYIEDKVYIERETGLIMHPLWLQNKYDARQHEVLHTGNSTSHYKAFTYTRGDIFVAATVKEFAKGNRKPMALLLNGQVITGFCY